MSEFKRDQLNHVHQAPWLEHQVGDHVPIRQRTGQRLAQLFRLAEAGPRIVCLCGSTRFQELFELANKDETLAGRIVLSVGYYGHVSGMPDEATKGHLDELHLHKVDLADEVVLISPRLGDRLPYVGTSTVGELARARRQGKPIRWFASEDLGLLDLNPHVLHERPGNKVPEHRGG